MCPVVVFEKHVLPWVVSCRIKEIRRFKVAREAVGLGAVARRADQQEVGPGEGLVEVGRHRREMLDIAAVGIAAVEASAAVAGHRLEQR